MNTDASRVVILVMGQCESHSDWLYFFVYSNLPSSAGIPCVSLLIGGRLIFTGYLLLESALVCHIETTLLVPALPSESTYHPSFPPQNDPENDN